MTPRLIYAVLSTLALSAICWPAWAKKSDRLQTINTAAKSTSAFNLPNSVTTLTGAVKVTQGSMVVTGDVAKLYFDADQQIARIVVTGRPAHFQELDEQERLVQGDAQTLDYDNIKHIAMLTTDAVVTVQDLGNVHAYKLTYNLDTTAIHAESTETGFVTGTVLPKQQRDPQPAGSHP